MVSVGEARKAWKEFGGEVKPFVKPVLIVFGIIMLGMLAILRANFSYVDDLARAAEGYKGWGNFSRYLSNILAMGLHGNGFLTDISPWGQIVGALVMAVAGVMLLYIIYGRKEFRWWELLVVSILALNPYFLQCLSYKFDAPFIAVAVLAMIVPLLVRKQKSWVYVGAVLVGTLTTCMTYQAALGILPMVTIAVAVRAWAQKEVWGKIWHFVLKTVVGYGLGLLIFKGLIMKAVDAYVVTELPGLMEIVPHTLGNLEQYYRLIVADLPKTWLALLAVVVLWFIVALVVRAKERRWLVAIVGMVTVGMLGMMCFGIYAVMEKPLFEPRGMLGVGALMCLMAVVVAEEWKAKKTWQRVGWGIGAVGAVGLAYLFGVFGFTYGNALAVQKDYTDFRIEAVLNDLEGLAKEGDIVEVAGSVGLAPALGAAVEHYPILGRLVPIEFAQEYWGQYKMMRYYGVRELQGEMLNVPLVEEYPIVVKDGWYHRLRKREGSKVIVVELRERS